jgi:hypothetical protein
VSDQDEIKFVHMRPPIQCVLWEHPDRLKDKFSEFFDEVETYEDGSHLTRRLYKCRECGQLYFYEWYEWVDWEGGNDESYSTLIPVHAQEEIAALKQTDIFSLMCFFPRLQWDSGKPSWNGRD